MDQLDQLEARDRAYAELIRIARTMNAPSEYTYWQNERAKTARKAARLFARLSTSTVNAN